MSEFLHNTSGLLAAIGVFCGGIAAMITVFYKMAQRKGKKRKSYIGVSIAGLSLLSLSIILFAIHVPDSNGNSINGRLTAEAWQAFNSKDYEKAVIKARACIAEFQSAADKKQKKLDEQSVPLPRTGKPLTEEEKQTILARGLLNEVATSFYIVGRAKEYLDYIQEAKQAYQQAN